MLYCELCMTLNKAAPCQNCGRKKLITLKNSDPVLLLERDAIWSGGIEDILKDADIPCMKRGVHGVALSTILGAGTETYGFYVPYADYDRAKSLMADFLPEDNECESD